MFRIALFWAITQPVLVIPYRPIGCPETSVRNDYTLRNCPEECSSRLRRGGTLKSRMHTAVQFNCKSDEALPWVSVPYSVSQPPGRGPVPGPGINYTGLREVLLEFVILVFQAFFMNKYFIVEII